MARGRGSSGRMGKQWDDIAASTHILTVDTTSAGNALVTSVPATLLRTMGSYVITPTSAPAALDAVEITVAIGIASADAFAVGSTALPDPGTEPEYPWIYWKDHTFFFATTTADPNSAASSVRADFDVKSMRKLKPREAIFAVVQYFSIVGAPPMQVEMAGTRLLLGLH